MGKEKLLRFIPVLVICGLFSLLSVALVGQQFYGRYTPREKMIDVLPAGKQLTVKINACAVYPGQFYLPPVSCEAMYDRSIRANTEGRRVEVE